MTGRYLNRYGKPAILIVLAACVVATLRKSIRAAVGLHPQHPGLLAAAMGLFVVHYLIQAGGWHLLLRSLGQPVALRDSIRMYFLSLIARWMPGRIWYTATRLYIGRRIGLSVTAVSFAMVLELVYILIGGLIVTIAFAGSVLRGFLGTPHGHIALEISVAALVACGTLIIRPSTLTSLSRVTTVRKIVRKIAGEELTDANQPEMKAVSSLMLICYFTLFWLYSGGMFGVLSAAFLPMNPERWTACLPAFAGSWLIGFFSFVTPAGLGAREFAMTLMLQQSMTQPAALTLSVASRVAMLITELLLAGGAFLFLRGDLGEMPFSANKRAPGEIVLSHSPEADAVPTSQPAKAAAAVGTSATIQ